MLRVYSGWLTKRPLLTKALTACAVTAAGDLGSQTLIEHRSLSQIDHQRLQRFAGLGLFVAAPTLHYWYGFLAKQFPTQILRRVLADQFVFAPVFLAGFIFGNEYLQHYSTQQATDKVGTEWPGTVFVNWLGWIPFQSLNFNFVPLPYQVLANNAGAVFWNAYLSWKLHHKQHQNPTSDVVVDKVKNV